MIFHILRSNNSPTSQMDMSMWYVIRVRPRQDKKAAHYFENAGIEYYLPLQRQLHQWSDRKKWVEVPVLSPYIFVKIKPHEFNSIFESPAVMNYVRYNKDYARVGESEIERIKEICSGREKLSFVSEDLKEGARVELKSSAFEGMKGEVVGLRKGKVLLHIDCLGSFVLVEVSKHLCCAVSG